MIETPAVTDVFFTLIMICSIIFCIMAAVLWTVSQLFLPLGMASVAKMLAQGKYQMDDNLFQMIGFGISVLIIPWIVRYQEGSSRLIEVLIWGSIANIVVSLLAFIITYFQCKRFRVNTKSRA